jgi:NADH dehydrogenase
VKGLSDLGSLGQSYDLCGPRVYTLRELVEYVGAVTGRRRPVVGLSDRLSYLQALAMEFLPVKLMTRDNYYSMKVDNVCRCDFPLGIAPTALEAVAPSYLGNRTPRSRYQRFRGRARRDGAR